MNVTSNTNDEIVSYLCFNDLTDVVEVEVNSSNPERTISIEPNDSSSKALEGLVDDPDYEPNGENLVDSDEERDEPTLNDGSRNIDINELPAELVNQPIHNDTNRELNVLPPERKRRKRQNVDEKDWIVNKNKAAREKGKYDIPREGTKLNQDVNVTIKTIRKLNVPSCQRMKGKLSLINFGRLVGLKKPTFKVL